MHDTKMRTLLYTLSFALCCSVAMVRNVEAGPEGKRRLHFDYNEVHVLARYIEATNTWHHGGRHLFDARLDVGDGGLFLGYHSWNDFHGDFMNTGQGAWFGRNRITIGHEDVGISVPSAWPNVDDWTWLIEIGLENQGDDHRPLDAQSAHIRLGYWRVHPAYSFNFIEGAWGEDFGSRFSHSFYLDGLLSIGSEEPFEPNPINISIEHFAIYDEGKLGSGGVKADDLYIRLHLYSVNTSAGRLALGLTFAWFEVDNEAFFQFGDNGEFALGGNIAFTF